VTLSTAAQISSTVPTHNGPPFDAGNRDEVDGSCPTPRIVSSSCSTTIKRCCPASRKMLVSSISRSLSAGVQPDSTVRRECYSTNGEPRADLSGKAIALRFATGERPVRCGRG